MTLLPGELCGICHTRQKGRKYGTWYVVHKMCCPLFRILKDGDDEPGSDTKVPLRIPLEEG